MCLFIFKTTFFDHVFSSILLQFISYRCHIIQIIINYKYDIMTFGYYDREKFSENSVDMNMTCIVGTTTLLIKIIIIALF